MIVVTGTAAVVLFVIGIIIWIAETTNKARRLAAQRAKNRNLRAQATQTPATTTARPGQAAAPGESGKQPPSMPYGM